ncbi:THUMP domain-containing class I SAM-dependent RNA methyltransferase [Anaerococcus urinomassiliensis]|uniref:THUMP domain-containing class I SAM-dependent RNA methyltransferase n=1 Tax=Anaerococcus urinomassiliensis TaxID=1745712 RepID=UPI000939D88F|nr:class I SAM-dependent RNA methyltransferase [Anaerococcus urinomassiliensis]
MTKFMITTSFGLESLVKWQLKDMGYENFKLSDGQIILDTRLDDVGKLNINLREADRVYLILKTFEAKEFDQLFEGIKAINWPDLLDKDSNFIVGARTYKSKLFSVRTIQSISEKAIVESMKTKYKINHFSKSSHRVQIEVSINKNVASVLIDTSGDGLHKRGYREDSVKAPLRENLAAGLVDLSFYNPDRFLFDGFCGSGTILIEAARRARNIAPGIDRSFDFENFIFIDKDCYKEAKKEALDAIDYDVKLNILGSDISGRAISLAKNNAINAGVGEDISFITRDIKSVALKDDYGILISNPPYGKRLSDFDTDDLYKKINDKFKSLDTWSLYFITSDENFDKSFMRKLSKKRKLYNGGQKVDFYQYFGKKPSN